MWEKIEPDNLLLVLIDMQDKFYSLIDKSVLSHARKNILLTINMFNKLNIPMIGTEQNTKGLGHTDPEILEIWGGPSFSDKITFSCCQDQNFTQNLDKLKRPTVVVAGLETHICVLQTVLDLISEGFQVLILSDACVSSTKLRWQNGLDLMKNEGAHLINTETLLFYLLKRIDKPEFKYMIKLIKDAANN